LALSVTTRRGVLLEIGGSSECGSVDLDLGWFAGIGDADIDVPAGFTHEALEAQRVNGNSAEMTTTTLSQLATQDAHI
jgi:hypothetical protein